MTELALALGASLVVNVFLVWLQVRATWRRAKYRRRQAVQRPYRSRSGVGR